MPDQGYRSIVWCTVIAVVACAAAVVICYFWIDRPVAFFVDRHQLNRYAIFRWLTYPPPVVQTWSPVLLAALVVLRAWRPFAPWQKALFVACVSLIVADQFRTSLGDVCGRYWPETWFDHNPSLIGDGRYGFHPFRRGDDVGSFPSGHAARILAFAGAWWVAVPRMRSLWIVVCPPMLVSLVAMNYHFVGDVIAGATLGGIVAAYAVHVAGFSGSCSRARESMLTQA